MHTHERWLALVRDRPTYYHIFTFQHQMRSTGHNLNRTGAIMADNNGAPPATEGEEPMSKSALKRKLKVSGLVCTCNMYIIVGTSIG